MSISKDIRERDELHGDTEHTSSISNNVMKPCESSNGDTKEMLETSNSHKKEVDSKNQYTILQLCKNRNFKSCILLLSFLGKKKIDDKVFKKLLNMFINRSSIDGKDILPLMYECLASHDAKYNTLVQYGILKKRISKKSLIGYLLVLFRMKDYNTLKKVLQDYYDTLKYHSDELEKINHNPFKDFDLSCEYINFESLIISNIIKDNTLNILLNPIKYFDIIFEIFFLDDIKKRKEPCILNCKYCKKIPDSDEYIVCRECIENIIQDGINNIFDKFICNHISLNGTNFHYIRSSRYIYYHYLLKIKSPVYGNSSKASTHREAIIDGIIDAKCQAEVDAEAKHYAKAWKEAKCNAEAIINGKSFNEVYGITCYICCEKTCNCITV